MLGVITDKKRQIRVLGTRVTDGWDCLDGGGNH